MPKSSVAIVLLNWNDAKLIPKSLGSLLDQSVSADIITVDNGSTDNSREVIESFGSKITAKLYNDSNLGFAGGVNTGIRYAIEHGYEYVALLNNDAVADKDWLKHLHSAILKDASTGATTCSLVHSSRESYDSTGDMFTIWGLAYPRGRGESAKGQYDKYTDIMGASGGGSLFRVAMLEDIGLFDEDFFAYYEDIDLGLRAHTRGWKFKYSSKAIAYHDTGSTSGRVKNFGTYTGLKNQPLVVIKNIPLSLLWRMLPRFMLAHTLFTLRALSRRQFTTVFKVWIVLLWLIPKKVVERWGIQHRRTRGGVDAMKQLIVYDLPHNATALRKFRSIVRKVFPRFV